jgi:hypothetical protein
LVRKIIEKEKSLGKVKEPDIRRKLDDLATRAFSKHPGAHPVPVSLSVSTVRKKREHEGGISRGRGSMDADRGDVDEN